MATCCSLKTNFTSKQLAASVLNSLITANLFNAVLRRTKRWKISLVALLLKAATDQDPFSWLPGGHGGKNLLRKCVFFFRSGFKKKVTLCQDPFQRCHKLPQFRWVFPMVDWLTNRCNSCRRGSSYSVAPEGASDGQGKWDRNAWRYKSSFSIVGVQEQ